jgi:hypothetical protein
MWAGRLSLREKTALPQLTRDYLRVSLEYRKPLNGRVAQDAGDKANRCAPWLQHFPLSV